MRILAGILIGLAIVYNSCAAFTAWRMTKKWYWDGWYAGISLFFTIGGIILILWGT